MDKRYYSISEVSEMLGINSSMLRYWETQFDALSPLRSDGGMRRYTPSDIETLRIIRFLLKDKGLHIAAAKKELAANRKALTGKADAVGRLREIRAALIGLRDALNARRH